MKLLEAKDFPQAELFIKPVVVLTGPGQFILIDGNTGKRLGFEGMVASQVIAAVDPEANRWRVDLVFDQVEVWKTEDAVTAA